MWKNIISQGLFQIVILGVILFKGISKVMQALKSSGFPRRSESRTGTMRPGSTTLSSSTCSCFCNCSTRSTPGSSSRRNTMSSRTSSTTICSWSYLSAPSSSSSPWSSTVASHSRPSSSALRRICSVSCLHPLLSLQDSSPKWYCPSTSA